MNPIRTLLIEDSADYANVVQIYFRQHKAPVFNVVWAKTLKEGLDLLAQEPRFDIVLTDLYLPDSAGYETFSAIQQQFPGIPVVVITAFDDEKVALKAVENGAQDYLVKGDVTGKLITRVLGYALQRHRMREELTSLSLTDSLTGLSNRRGFATLAEQQVKLSHRLRRGFLVIVLDLDGLKAINDRFGHAGGDEALKMTAEALKKTFRESDIVARIGGDEFAVMAIDAGPLHAPEIMARLSHHLDELNARKQLPCAIALSTGMAYADPEVPSEIGPLIEQADKKMYEQKSLKQSGR
ncbi:MAG: GGDEF domain-containing response regulator [Candidatus Omnitrophota bacterium]